jgi:hypothetical protein
MIEHVTVFQCLLSLLLLLLIEKLLKKFSYAQSLSRLLV